MSSVELLDAMKALAVSRGYVLAAEDITLGGEFLPEDQFVVRDSEGNMYCVRVDVIS